MVKIRLKDLLLIGAGLATGYFIGTGYIPLAIPRIISRRGKWPLTSYEMLGGRVRNMF